MRIELQSVEDGVELIRRFNGCAAGGLRGSARRFTPRGPAFCRILVAFL